MISIYMIIVFLAQAFPDLPTPTPWETPTPMPTMEFTIDDAEQILATTEANQYDFSVNGDQVYFDNQPLLPNLESGDSVLLFGYFKWVLSSGSQSVLGPFAPLMIPLGILMSLSFISLLMYFWENVIVTIYKLVMYIINGILRLFGR